MLALVVGVLPARAVVAQGVTPAGAAAIVHQGNGRGAAACVSCHGPDLMGLAAMTSPRLAGQDSEYVLTQLDAFAEGARNNAVMRPVASSLSAAERRALAAYVSRLPVTSVVPASALEAQPPSADAVRQGAELATVGRWSSGLPACDRCHGPGGVGVGSAMPPLAGQSSVYLSNQLRAYRQGVRPPGPLALMGTIAGRMTESDVQAVSAYYSTVAPVPSRSSERHP
jgi:cytochrome c553